MQSMMQAMHFGMMPMIVEHYPVEPGKLLAGEYPGHQDPSLATRRLEALVTMGVRTFIDLTTPKDGLLPYEGLLPEVSRKTGHVLTRHAFPIRDMDVPNDPETTRAVMRAIREAIEAAPAVYLHCWGGIGRTGTIVGCWLRETGFGPQQALETVQQLYSEHMPKSRRIRHSPQTTAQLEYVRCWQPSL